MVYSLLELLDKLKKEDNSSYFYRGQNQKYDYPLWPSMYRGVAIINTMEIPAGLSRCGRGHHFGFRSNWLVDEKYRNPDNIKLRELKRLMMGYVRNALGYCLSEAMFQQAGWESEGLDITSNINIALFFASHYYQNGVYHKDMSSNIRVIYRWKLPEEYWSLDKLNNYDYYNCPALFPSKKILNLFEECSSNEEFEESIWKYRNAIDWNNNFDYTYISGRRPFNIIKIPAKWKQFSRIVNQDAALLFPDSISLEKFSQHYIIPEKTCQEVMSNGGSFIEDLSTAHNCEIFLFKLEPKDFNLFEIDENKIYINDDYSHLFLSGWMKSFFQNPYGTPVIRIPGDDNYLSQIDMKLNLSKLRFEDNERKFNG